MGLRIFLQGRNDFAAKTEFGIVLRFFCGIEVRLRIFLSEETKEEILDFKKFCPKKHKGEEELDIKYFVQVKGRRRVK